MIVYKVYFDMDSVLADFVRGGTGIVNVSAAETMEKLRKMRIL